MPRPISFARKLAASAMALAAMVYPATAQSEAPDIRADAKAAFVQPYGAAMVQQFAREIIAAADASCLQARNIAAPQITDGAREILTHYASQIVRLDNTPSQQRILYGLLQKKGDEASLARLRAVETSPAMQEVRRFQPPTVNANLANDTGDFLNRYVVRHKLPLKGALGWVTDGNMEMSILWERESAVPDEVTDRAAPQVEELLRLITSHKQEIDSELERLSPTGEDFLAAFTGLETRLAALCVPAARKP